MRPEMLLPGGLLALLWGFLYSMFLWNTRPGQWLRLRQTWISVVAGVAGTVMVMGLVLEFGAWLVVWGAFALSGLSVVGFSVFVSAYGEHVEQMARSRDSAQPFDSAQGEKRGR